MATRPLCSYSVLLGIFLQRKGILGLTLVLSACSSSTEADSQRTRIEVLERQVDALSKRFMDVESHYSSSAWLRPTEKEFQYVDTDLGRLAITIDKVTALANGSEVELHFGNTTAASVSGLKYHLAWGPVDAQGLAIPDQAQSADKTLDQPLFSGSWNTIKVPLANVPPSRLGYVEISNVTTTRIVLTPR